MRKSVDRAVEVFLREAERRGACLESPPGPLRKALETRVRAGSVVRPWAHLYARADYWRGLTPRERALHRLRGLHELHPDWVFSGVSAAVAHGLSVSYAMMGSVEIAVSSGSGSRGPGRVTRRYVTGDAAVTAAGVPVTSLGRTAFDCMRSLDFRRGLAVADSCLRVSGRPREWLVDLVAGMRGGCHGVGQARVTAAHADPLSENGGESIARAAMWELGFATPRLQVSVPDPVDPGRVHRVDYCWVDSRGGLVYGELDGGEKYENPEMTRGEGPVEVMRRERRRESRITAGRTGVVRFSLEEVGDAAFFSALLDAFGVPRDHEPLIDVAAASPATEVVPVEAYGLL